MYYVNQEQINARLAFIPTVTKVLRELDANRDGNAALIEHFAEERALYLGIEAVTDVGSLLIDGFMMRDASSYEDIVDVLRLENVLPEDIAVGLRQLIALRKSLTQDYMYPRREALRDDLDRIASLLDAFPPLVTAFIRKELQPFGQ